ncbi:MAG: DNA polymerase I, partial [Deltaproteobacteria bacterium]
MPTKLPPPGDARTLYVLDLSGFVFRAYHALPPLSNSSGEPTHATLGVANMLARLVKDQKPVYLAVAMDSKSDKSLRKAMYPEYKATRPPAPPDLAVQMARCREIVEAYAIPVLQQEGYEADDLLAACVREARSHGLHTVLCTADKDLMQLVGDDVVMWDAMRNRVFGPDEVKEKWGVGPERVRDLLALMGDTSDNVPGVQGVGEKTAARLITEYGSLDGVYANIDKVKGKLRENLARDEQSARLSYDLVGLEHDLPVALDLEKLKYGGWDAPALRTLLLHLEFTKLANAVTVEPGAHAVATAHAVSSAPTPVFTLTQPAAATATTSSIEASLPLRYETVLTDEALSEAVSACMTARRMSVGVMADHGEAMRARLVGIALSWAPRQAVYIPIGHRVIGDPRQLARTAVFARLAPLLADASVAKVAHDVKFDEIVLRRAGLPVNGWAFDTMLASYLCDPERHTHRLDEIALAELNHTMASLDGALKRERGKTLTIDEVDIATVTRLAAERADLTRTLSERLAASLEEAQLTSLLRDLEMPLTHVLAHMEETGVLVDAAMLRTLSVEFGVEIDRLEKKLHELAGHDFNVNSPRQLETVLFDEMHIKSVKRTKTSRSTDHEVLEELSEDHEIARRVIEHRQLTKLRGTYLDALPALVNPTTGRIHTTYSQAVAATGRLSSNNPNLQNIPIRSEQGGRIREAFVASPGRVILSADYSQIELRVLAHLSHDPILVDAFQKNEDIHTRTA